MKRNSLLFIAALTALALARAPAAPAAIQYKYKVLHTFTGGLDGGFVATTPVLDASGNLYGTTSSGGTSMDCENYGCGVVYRLTPGRNGSWKEAVLLNFDQGTGFSESYAPLLFDGRGNLFGSTVAGGAYTFELTPAKGQWTFNPIYHAGYCLVFDRVGNLFGCYIGSDGDGETGELSPGQNGWTYTHISDQTGSPAALSWDTQGNLYGTYLYGGNGCGGAGCGSAFQLSPNGDGTWTYRLLHEFGDIRTDGRYPYAGLTVDASGNAYGVTYAGGKYGEGTFFKLTPTKSGPWKETILYQFPNCDNGCGPAATLVLDKAGNFYGSEGGGISGCGSYPCGVIFRLTPKKNGQWKYSVVHKFNGTDGSFPYGVVLDQKKNIFGAGMYGGKYGYGVAFEITP